MNSSNRMSRKYRREEKARYLFPIYQQLGPDRSLKSLCELCTKLGLKIAESTLKNYSVDFDWQKQILQINAKEHEVQEKSILSKIDEMNEADAQMARGLRALVVAAINRIREQMRIDQMARQAKLQPGQTAPLMLDMTFVEMASLAKAAQYMERLARGQAILRTEIWIEVVDTVIQEFALIFMAVNKIQNEEERMNEFGRLSDEMVTRYYSQTVKQGIGKVN